MSNSELYGKRNTVQLRPMAHTCKFLDLHGALLRDSFPALRLLTVATTSGSSRLTEKVPRPPWLHILAIGRPIPGTLKTIVLQVKHDLENNICCKLVVGRSEMVDSETWLPELLPGLEELTFRLDYCKDLERCARYIWSVLPGMQDALRFEYRPGYDGHWLPYTLPDTT